MYHVILALQPYALVVCALQSRPVCTNGRRMSLLHLSYGQFDSVHPPLSDANCITRPLYSVHIYLPCYTLVSKMPTPLLEALTQPLEAFANAQQVGTSEIPAKVDDIWQSAWSSSKTSRQSQGSEALDDKQIDLVKVVLEIVGRNITLLPTQSGTVS